MGGEISTNHVCKYPLTFSAEFARRINESDWFDPENAQHCVSNYANYYGRPWLMLNLMFYFLFYLVFPTCFVLKISNLKALARVHGKQVLDMPQFPVLFFTSLTCFLHAASELDMYGLRNIYDFDFYMLVAELRNVFLVLIGFSVVDFLASLNAMKVYTGVTKRAWYCKLLAFLLPVHYIPLLIALSDKEIRYNLVMGIKRSFEACEVLLVLFNSETRKRSLVKELRRMVILNMK
eukprot:snap_masked-scaffold_15-processed-gene-8.27-mRNA-1 protein AED:1.00 eAED:1.00 QI:0/-1/0/0/-1/1/1/0/234